MINDERRALVDYLEKYLFSDNGYITSRGLAKYLDEKYIIIPKSDYNEEWPRNREDLKNGWFPEPTNATDHSYYNDKNGKDLFYHFKNGVMNTEMYKGFLVGNIFKYITRHGKKDKSKTIEDLKKARDYLDELIKFESDDQ